MRLQQVVQVTPKLQAEYKVVLLDRELSSHQESAETKLRPDPVYVELWLEQDLARPVFDKGAMLTVKGTGKIDLYEDEALKTQVDLSKALPNDKVTGGKKLKLWAVGTGAGKLELELTPEDSGKPGFAKAAPEKLELGVVELKSKLFQWDDAAPPAMKALSDEDKVKKGRLLHVQSAHKDHARARLVLEKIDPNQWPADTDDYELVLTDQSSGGALELFEAEWDGNAKAFPYKLKKSDLAAGDKEVWVQGKKASAKLLDARIDLGLDRPAEDPAKEAKKGGDWARFTVIELDKVAPSTEFAHPSADYTHDKLEVLINLKADGHKLKVKAKLKQAFADVPLYFMLAADKDNGLVGNTGVAVPAGMKKVGGAAWTWDDIDAARKKKDKANAGDYWHLSAKTDAKGEAEVELQLSQIGGEVFYVGAYCGQDPHLSKYKHDDPTDGKRKPTLSKKLTVWRKLWYQLCKAESCGAPTPGSAEAAYERAKAHLKAGTTHKYKKADLPGPLQDRTFYPQWMVKSGGGNTLVAVVGAHNWAHFRTNEGTFFPKTDPDEVDVLKARVLVVDHQWDPAGWTAPAHSVLTSKVSHEINMGGFVVKPALQGNLAHNSSHWQAIKKSDGSVADQGPLIDDNILVEKSRTSLEMVKVRLPNAADPYLAKPADFEIRVELVLAQAEEFLGESKGRHILAVYDSTNVSDYNDTVAHEIGHSVKQTPRPPLQPTGMPDHAWWNTGMGTHCSNPTTPRARSPVRYNNKAVAHASALCLMFESGPVPNAGNKFCDYCHQYLLAQDMHSIA